MMEEKLYKTILENFYEGVYYVDKHRTITFWNQGAERISGFTSSEVLGKACFNNILNHVDNLGNQLCFNGCPLHETITDGDMREGSLYLHHKNGHRVPVTVRTIAIYNGDTILGAVEIFVDDSKKHELLEQVEELKVLALKDQLTGLANRHYINNFLSFKMNEFKMLGIPFGIAFMDIDNFRDFNNQFDHLTGDEVLKIVAKTMSSVVRSSDLVGRWGGEEFVAVLTGINEEQLLNICEKIRMLTEASSLRKNESNLSVTISIGATIFKEEDTIQGALERVDGLLFQSKGNGKNCVTLG
ncbi:diguanylate cyclase [Bacillaceae bacterium IKA-2]|nr:diguanylate cyclase [Bacillaceae bacterium IKA-2]